jgi:hypothetical protein
MLPTESTLSGMGEEGRSSRWRRVGYKRSDLDIEGDNDMALLYWLAMRNGPFPKSFK